jgi:uncharacterized protein
MTVVQITPKPELSEPESGCCQPGSACACAPAGSGPQSDPQSDPRSAAGGCGCQGLPAEPPAGEAAGQEIPAVTVTSELRTSSYIIYVDLPDNDSDMLIVHGYTGAFDKVSKRIATFLRGKEDRRAPKPLYGNWTPDLATESAADIPESYQRVLVRRGYLTYLTREAELERFRLLADEMHAQAQWPSYVLMPTYDCNLRCFYCFQDHMRSNPDFSYLLKRMTHPMVDRIFDAMPNIEAIHGLSPEDGYRRPITLFGGEPLLRENRDLIEHILDRARQGGTESCAVVTNGTDLDAYADLLGSAGLSALQITLDGIPVEHDKRRIYPGGQGSFDRIAANITLALDHDATVSVRLNIDRGNIEQLPVLAQIFVDQGWEDRPGFKAYATVITASNANTDRKTVFSSWELDQELARLQEDHPVMRVIEPRDSDIRRRARSVFGGGHASLQTSFCSAHSGMYVIDRFGDMYACWERTGNAKTRIGRINQDSTVDVNEPFSALWRGRSVTSNNVCRQCRYALYCGGGCAVQAEGRKGRIDANYCDGYAFRFRAMVAEAYAEYVNGTPAGNAFSAESAAMMSL